MAQHTHKTIPETNFYYFIENKGQWDTTELFRAEIPQGRVLITKKEIVYQLFHQEEVASTEKHGHAHASKPSKIKGQVVSVSFPNATTNYTFQKSKQTETHFQYLFGNDKDKWARNVRAWQQIELHNLYKGIDLKLYFTHDGLLKYDFVVQPLIDANQIEVVYQGADSLYLQDDHLVVETALGKIFEKPPYTYQYGHHGQKQIPCKFQLTNNRIRFRTGKYDASKPLIIDPQLIFSTYSGSRADNFGNTATYDDSGNMYTGGIVLYRSAQLPTVPGPFETFKGGFCDAFIMKYSPDGRRLLAAIYIGGADTEFPISMIVNHAHELLIYGATSSPDFPVTSQAFDNTFNGGSWVDPFYTDEFDDYSQPFRVGSDIFITRVDATTFDLLSSTYIGGSDNDGITYPKTPCAKNYGDQLRGEIMVDAADNVYVNTQSYSSTINGAPNTAPQHTNKGLQDALIVKLDPSLSTLIWHRFLGGSEHDAGFGIRVDEQQQVYSTGGTTSTNIFGNGVPGFRNSYTGGIDGYIAKISADGASIVGGTYLGTPAYDQTYFIDLDYNKDVYVVGQTQGAYPVTAGKYNNPNSGQFIHKLSNDLGTSVFSTVFGSGSGSPNISLTAFMVNNCRKIFVSGWGGETNETQGPGLCWDNTQNTYIECGTYFTGYVGGNTFNMPLSRKTYQATTTGSGFYFIVLHPEATALAYATHFGGAADNREHVDGGTSRFDPQGIIYQSVCAGCGREQNFPTFPSDVYSSVNRSNNCNNGSIKFDLDNVIADFLTIDSIKNVESSYGCVPVTFRLSNKSIGASNYFWDIDDGNMWTKDDSLYIQFTKRGLKHLRLVAMDTTICRKTDTAYAVINAGEVNVDFPRDKITCGIQPFTPDLKLYSPWATVEWSPTTGVSDPHSPNPVITPPGDIKYVITVKDDTLCTETDTLRVKIRTTSPEVDFIVMDSAKTQEKYTFCYPSTAFFKSLSKNYDTLNWYEDNQFLLADLDSFHYYFPHFGSIRYKLVVQDTICHTTLEKERTVVLSYPLASYPDNVKVCPDSMAYAQVLGDPSFTYKWSPSELFTDPTAWEQYFKPKESGTVVITVTDSIGCTSSGSFDYGLFATSDPVPDERAKICPKKTSGVNLTAIELSEYNWYPSGFTGNPYFVSVAGPVYFRGVSLDGCPVSDTVQVVLKCDPEIHVPNAFTPDGDGKNDFFEVFGHEITKFDIKIFDRWGEIIYHSTDFRFNWDGKYKGQTVPIGTYPYVIHYEGVTFEYEPISKTISGDVTVIK